MRSEGLIVCQGVSANTNYNKRYPVHSVLHILACLTSVALFGHQPSTEFQKLFLRLKIVLPNLLTGYNDLMTDAEDHRQSSGVWFEHFPVFTLSVRIKII